MKRTLLDNCSFQSALSALPNCNQPVLWCGRSRETLAEQFGFEPVSFNPLLTFFLNLHRLALYSVNNSLVAKLHMCQFANLEFENSDYPFALCIFYILVHVTFCVPQFYCIVLLHGKLSINVYARICAIFSCLRSSLAKVTTLTATNSFTIRRHDTMHWKYYSDKAKRNSIHSLWINVLDNSKFACNIRHLAKSTTCKYFRKFRKGDKKIMQYFEKCNTKFWNFLKKST